MPVEKARIAHTSYLLTPARDWVRKLAYEGQRGLQPVQAEQMALQYVKAYGKITRKQAAELCKIFPMPTGFALRGGSPAH